MFKYWPNKKTFENIKREKNTLEYFHVKCWHFYYIHKNIFQKINSEVQTISIVYWLFKCLFMCTAYSYTLSIFLLVCESFFYLYVFMYCGYQSFAPNIYCKYFIPFYLLAFKPLIHFKFILVSGTRLESNGVFLSKS